MRMVKLENDWTKLFLDPKEGVPFMGEWLDVLASRGFALPTKTIINREGKPEDVLKAIDRFASTPTLTDDDGVIWPRCIGCGEAIREQFLDAGYRKGYVRPVFEMTDRIRIGGWIQIPKEKPNWSKKQIVRYWASMPVMMLGLGCKACRNRFQDVVRETNSQNGLREMWATFLANKRLTAQVQQPSIDIKKAMQEKCLHGMVRVFCAACNRKPKQQKVESLPGAITPFIDVFDRSIDAPLPEQG